MPLDERSDGFQLCVLDDDVIARLDVDPLGGSGSGSVKVDENRHLRSVRQFSQDDRFAGADRNVAVECRTAGSGPLPVVGFSDRDRFQNVEVPVARKSVFSAAEQAARVEVLVVSRRDEDDVSVFENDVLLGEVDRFVFCEPEWDPNGILLVAVAALRDLLGVCPASRLLPLLLRRRLELLRWRLPLLSKLRSHLLNWHLHRSCLAGGTSGLRDVASAIEQFLEWSLNDSTDG